MNILDLQKELESFKDKFKLHIFTAEKNFVKRAISNLKMEKNVIINDNIPYLEFLNLTTKFDVLIVSDANTKNYFEINPYLPSKIADYCGSGSDIWGICEEGSMLDKSEDITFKSRLGDFLSSKYIVNKIIFEKINSNYSLTKDEMDFKNFYFNLDNKINVMSNLENDEKILGSNLYEVINYLSIRNMNLNNPTLIGFGINSHASFEHACQYAHGAIVGTAFINEIQQNGIQQKTMASFINNIKTTPNSTQKQTN